MLIRASYTLSGIAIGSLVLGLIGHSPLVGSFALLTLLGLIAVGISERLRSNRV